MSWSSAARAMLAALLLTLACAGGAQAKFAYQPQSDSEAYSAANSTPAVASLTRTSTALIYRDTGNQYDFARVTTDSLTRKSDASCGDLPIGSAKFSSDPAVVAWSSGRLDVFGRGTGGDVVHYSKNGTSTDCTPSWSGADSLGGTIVGRPAAVSRRANQLQVYARGTNNQVYERYWGGTAWSSWASLGGALTSSPAAAAWSDATYIFGVFAGGIIQYRAWTATDGWGAWTSLASAMGSVRASGSPTASSQGANQVDLVFRGTDGHLYHMAYTGSWGAPDDLGPNAGNTDPSVDDGDSLVGELWTGSATATKLQRRVLDPYGASSLNYTALGDGYASGEGTLDVDPALGTDCPRTDEAYPFARAGAFHADYGRTWFLACGNNVDTPGVLSSQVPKINALTKVVTVSSGAYDVDVAYAARTCASDASPIPSGSGGTARCGAAIEASWDAVSSLTSKLDALYAGIKAHAPAGGYRRVVVTMYPHLVGPTLCSNTGYITAPDATALNETVDMIDDQIKAAVNRVNDPTWVIADPRPAFAAHTVCAPSGAWLNGTSSAASEAWFPNAAGWSALGQSVVETARIDF